MTRLWILIAALLALPALAQERAALAHLRPGESRLEASGGGLRLHLALTQGVPYRVFTLADPWRVVADFAQVDWAGFAPAPVAGVAAVRTGRLGGGWSRVVLELDAPMRVAQAGMATGTAGADLTLALEPVDAAAFRASAGAPAAARHAAPERQAAVSPGTWRAGARPLRIAIDPGHGGIDPGAEYGGVREADLMLTYALALKEALVRAGYAVILTRAEDAFVPLEARVSIARAAGADLFLSLHADALAEGRASGATIYTLSETASDDASRKLAERHDRGDLLAGVDLTHQDDVVAGVLMDLARAETMPRSDRLADALVASLKSAVGGMHKRPRLEAAFSVLKAPDIPSVLIELGFLSSSRDLARLTDPNWRDQAVAGIVAGIGAWAADDAALSRLVRQ